MASTRDRDQTAARLNPEEAPDMIFEIGVADGAEAERLRLEQARVLWEVTTWVAQKRSNNGRDRAA